MYIRRYSFFTILFLIVSGWAVYTFITQDYAGRINLFHGEYFLPDMPVAVDILLPAILLFILTLGHMMFYGVVDYFENRAKNSDFKKLESAIEMNLKNKRGSIQYSTSLYRDIGEVLNISQLKVNSADVSEKNKFKPLLETIASLQSGDVVNVDNSLGYYLREMNYWNALKESPEKAEEILMTKGFSDELYIEAFNQLCKVNTFTTIQRYIKWLNIEALFNIIRRVDQEENGITITNDILLDLIDSLSFTRADYTRMAKVVSNMSPDLHIELFKHLSEKSEEAFEGYLYTLLHFEMIEEAEELIGDSTNEDLSHIKAYILLKKADNQTLLDIDFFFRS
jgi:hypothetical protein